MLEDIVNIRNECLNFLHSWEMNLGEAVTNPVNREDPWKL